MYTRDYKLVLLGAPVGMPDVATEVQRKAALLKAGVLQDAIFDSANFSSIATDEKGAIQLFNVGAQRMPGYIAAEAVDKIAPADISDVRKRSHAPKWLAVRRLEPCIKTSASSTRLIPC